MGMQPNRVWYWGALLAALAGCKSEPALVASNCDKQAGCVSREALKIDAVDILLVIDDSPSIAGVNRQLKEQLPRMLNAITTGDDEDISFPPAKSVHVAVTTTDLGAGEGTNIASCSAWGRDGTFVKPDEFGLTCEVDYPGYLAFEGGPAPIATVDTVGCVPLVTPQDMSQGAAGYGCGFEQPLEATLKALLPEDAAVTFVHGEAHGDRENAGFLRENSLLVVIVVSDEDDCSTSDYGIFDPLSEQNRANGVNAACTENNDKLFDAERYVDNLKKLRPNNDNVIFAVIGGVPPNLVADDYRANFDLTTDEGVRGYYDLVLSDVHMQEALVGSGMQQHLAPSCHTDWPQDQLALNANPPRRLLKVARGFGAQSVVASICDVDFGPAVGRMIRTIGEQLAGASGD
jgi:hypothetical protein